VRGIANQEMQLDERDGRWQGVNRRQDLRFAFGDDGAVEIRSRTDESRRVTLRLASVARGEGAAMAAPGELRAGRCMDEARKNAFGRCVPRLEMARAGVTEWYDNGRDGLEQGFDVATRPAGDGPLVVAIDVAGGRAEQDGARAMLVGSKGERLAAYGKLVTRDANGREAAGLIRALGGRIELVLDDRGLAYPIAIDPLVTAPAAILESNQASASFGCSVSGAGDLDGDGYADLVVGAQSYDNGETDEGAAFVYYGAPTGVGTTPTVLDSNMASALFGASVSGAGDLDGDGYGDLVVGAPYYNNGHYDEGAVYVYYGGAGGLGTTPVVLESNQQWARLGASVSAAGDVNGDGYDDLVAGAYWYASGQTNEGAAFVYYGSAAGVGASPTILESNQVSAEFGKSVSGAGDLNGDGFGDVVVGADRYDNGQTDEGAAFVYYGSAAGIGTTPTILEDNDPSAYVGESVSGAGDLNGDGYADLVVGAGSANYGEVDEGLALVYYGSAAGIGTFPTRLQANQAGAQFGHSVSGAGDLNGDGYADLVVGAQHYDDGETDEGAAFVFYGGVSLVGATATRLEVNQAGALYGSSVSGAGDLNGDGYADLVVGASGYGNGEAGEGGAFVYYGGVGSHNSLVVTDATVGTACDAFGNGGIRIRSGVDDGAPTGTADDGVLQDGEVDSTAYVCNGASGSQDGHDSIIVTDAVVGTACDAQGNGGTRIRSGVDDGLPAGTADDATLQDGEVDSTVYVCNGATGGTGHDSIVVTDAIVGAACDAQGNGGTRIRNGVDDGTPAGTAGDGTLQDGEVDSTAIVCNGAAGGTGHDSIIVTDATVGAACDAYGNGGTRVRSGVDDGAGGGVADDGALQDGEVDSTAYVCNGATGGTGSAGHDSIIVTDATIGTACDAQGNGGTRLRSGVDDGAGGGIADDGVLQDGEVDSTAYVCNGADAGTGAAGHGSIILTDTAVGTACDAYGNGGQRIRMGADDGTPAGTADDGLLDGGEVDATAIVCNGPSVVSLVAMVDEPAGANCTYGGKLIQSGIDADRDGTLDASEVSQSAYVCNGPPGAAGESGGCASAPGLGGAWLALAGLLGMRRRSRGARGAGHSSAGSRGVTHG
jgi:hypothetical protein